MFAGDVIFVMFPRNAYFLFISVSRPPLAGVRIAIWRACECEPVSI